MYRVALIVLLCFCNMIFLCSCNGSHEIDDMAYPSTIGIDKGSEDKLRFTYQIPNIKSNNGNVNSQTGQVLYQAQGNNQNFIASIDCANFYSGVNMINSAISRTLNFVHTKYIFISEDLAKEGVGTFINGMIRSSQIRRITHIIIVKGSAQNFIKDFNPLFGTSLSKSQELMMSEEDVNSYFDDVSYNEFEIGLKSNYSQATAALGAINSFSNTKIKGSSTKEFISAGSYTAGELPRSGGNKFEFFGNGIFDGDKMIGRLNGDEARAMMMLKGHFKTGSIVIADPRNDKLRITVNVREQKNPQVKVSFKNKEPIINVKIFLEGDLRNLQSSTEYESPKLKPVLEAAFKKFIKGNIDSTINKCKSLNCEVFNFGETAAIHFSTIKDWENYKWLSHFKNAEVTTSVDFVIRRTGTMTKTSDIESSEGKKK